jgi:hypothetical protein
MYYHERGHLNQFGGRAGTSSRPSGRHCDGFSRPVSISCRSYALMIFLTGKQESHHAATQAKHTSKRDL